MRKSLFALALIALSAALFAQAPAASKDGPAGPAPQAAKAAQATLTGVLTFVDDRPAIKTDSGTIFLAMPDFYKYAYTDGIKAGSSVKATGLLIGQGDAKDGGQPTLVAKELSVGSKTYIVVGGAPSAGPEGRGPGGPMPGPGGPQGDQAADQPKALGDPAKAGKL